ncbi:3-hydroxyacyl-ACP dehydratase FabZ [Psychrobacter lutiphocae]|uniref:3-hydroxyacyl-ACP dehydratase FabZ n=1 Tax=Psychrobacter lutiphocae TaxID=540500 RepID=UPI0004755F8D|nr:3-hydroxyacyl-ACP dehydratase FabZ [Psychrobacter lutiphocae]
MSAEDEQFLTQTSVRMPMAFDQLKSYLPHRYPFMLIDRVTACCPNTWITGYKNVSFNEPFFQGHFPEEPIMPGVLIVEALAQLSGILAFISEGITAEDGHLFLFAGVDKVRFRNPVIPGDRLTLKSELLLVKRNIYKFDSRAFVDDTLAASAQLMIIRQDRVPRI